MHTDLWLLMIVAIVVLALAWLLPHGKPGRQVKWRPQGLLIPRRLRLVFFGGVLAVADSYAIGAVFVGLGSQIGHGLLHSNNALVNGAIIAISCAAIGFSAIVARGADVVVKVIIGAIATIPGMLALVIAGWTGSLGFFIAAALLTGIAFGLSFAGGLAMIGLSSPPERRAAVLSTGYLVAYAVQAGTAVGLGVVATMTSLQVAVEAGLAIIVGLAIAASVLVLVGRRDGDRGGPEREMVPARARA
jgi:hypothetical protein